MGVTRYTAHGKNYWRIDEWLPRAKGPAIRFRQRQIPTREQAKAILAKVRTEAWEGRYFDRKKEPSRLTVGEIWDLYEPVGRWNGAHRTDKGRAAHLVRVLGAKRANELTLQDIDRYRSTRRDEVSPRTKRPVTEATVDREVELLRRILNFAVKPRVLDQNPIVGVEMVVKPQECVRKVTMPDDVFDRVLSGADDELKPILVLLRDTAMRSSDVLQLTWAQELSINLLRHPIASLRLRSGAHVPPRTLRSGARRAEALGPPRDD